MKRSILIGAVLLLAASPILAANKGEGYSIDSVQMALDETIATADQAIHHYGVTDSAMWQIQAALAKLAKWPSLKSRVPFTRIHGSKTSSAAVVASRGDDSITLIVSKFDPGRATPVHDHLTWGVTHILEGKDHYTRWEITSDPNDTSHAQVKIAKDSVLGPGSSSYWLGPPHDLHTQEAVGRTLYELVLAGKNIVSSHVLEHRHYYDTKTGRVVHTPPK